MRGGVLDGRHTRADGVVWLGKGKGGEVIGRGDEFLGFWRDILVMGLIEAQDGRGCFGF